MGNFTQVLTRGWGISIGTGPGGELKLALDGTEGGAIGWHTVFDSKNTFCYKFCLSQNRLPPSIELQLHCLELHYKQGAQ